jgi:hypothetical protein
MNRNAEFDIFLSHTFGDKELVERAVADIRLAGRSVYVDWLTDAQLDRSRVDANTADLLRNRIKRCGSLFFAVSTRSPLSKWMPWELGYADAWSGRVFIFPLDDKATVMARAGVSPALSDRRPEEPRCLRRSARAESA